MKVTRVNFYDVNDEENCDTQFLSRCSIVLDDAMILNDIRIFNGVKNRYIVMPERCEASVNSGLKRRSNIENKKSEDLFYPVKKEYFEYLVSTILKGFDEFQKTGNSNYRPV